MIFKTGQIIPVSRFNTEQSEKYRNAIQEWRDGKRTGYPNVGLFLYLGKNGLERKKGFVLILPHGSIYRKTKKEIMLTKEYERLRSY